MIATLKVAVDYKAFVMKKYNVISVLASSVLIIFGILWLTMPSKAERQMAYIKKTDVSALKCSDFKDAVLGLEFKRPRVLDDYNITVSYVGNILELPPKINVEASNIVMPSGGLLFGRPSVDQAIQARDLAIINTIKREVEASRDLRESFLLCSLAVEASETPFDILASVTSQEGKANIVSMEMR